MLYHLVKKDWCCSRCILVLLIAVNILVFITWWFSDNITKNYSLVLLSNCNEQVYNMSDVKPTVESGCNFFQKSWKLIFCEKKLIHCVFFLVFLLLKLFPSTIPARPAEAVDTTKQLHAGAPPKNHANQKSKSDDIIGMSSSLWMIL